MRRFVLAGGAVLMIGIALPEAHDPITTRVTWEGDISRIVQARCITCHGDDGPGRMPLTSYDEAKRWAKAIKEEVMTRRMPKWHAVRGYGDFSNDPSLSAFEIALIAAWADGGAPKGIASSPAIAPIAKPAARAATPSEGREVRELTLPCGPQSIPEGTLLAVQPELEENGSVGIAVRFPDGRREIVAWIRGFEPEFPTTYRLRTPVALPAGTVLEIEPRERCTVTVTLTARR